MGRTVVKSLWYRGRKKEVAFHKHAGPGGRSDEMKQRSHSLIVLLLGLTLAFAAACETGPDLSNIPKTPTPDPKAPPAEKELAGVYDIEGSNEFRLMPFTGNLTIENREKAYHFQWQTTRGKFVGTGVQMNDAVAVAWAKQADGKDCGVALYKIAPDGSLDGRIATWGEYSFGTEKATRLAGENFDGKYAVTGTKNSGKEYKGTIDVSRKGNGYQFDWHTGVESTGFGTWRGDRAAIGFGGPQCSFTIYQVQPNGTLGGRWGSQRTLGFGFETAKKQ